MRVTRSTAHRHGFVAAATLGLIGGLFALPAAEAEPNVTAKDVEKALHKVEALNEKANQIDENAQQIQGEIDDITGDIQRDMVDYNRQKDELSAAIVQQQMDAPLGPTVNLLGSGDPEKFLAGLGAVQALNSSRADALEQFGESSRELRNRRAQLDDRNAELQAAKKDAAAKKQQMRKKYDVVKAQLDRLNAAEKAKLDGGGSTEMPTNVPVSGRAKAAVDFALAQLGEPYAWGGTGPNSWDCSGLMQASWRAAGVSIPRVVGPQYGASTPIPMSALKPGDLVFYGDMSHDGMYIGNGRVVHAPRPGRSVEIMGLSGYTKAGRIG